MPDIIDRKLNGTGNWRNFAIPITYIRNAGESWKAHRYDFKLVNTHSQKLDFSKMECGRLLKVIASQKIRSIRHLASIYGRSRQWIYLYLEAMASVKVIGIDKSGYCVLDPQKIPMVGSIVIKGILGELRSKAGMPPKQRAPYQTKKRMDQHSQQAL